MPSLPEMGKSHVLAAVVSEARKKHQPALLLLGEQFTEQAAPWSQFTSIADWSSTADTLLAALNQSAIAFGAPALLFIDAVNETPHRKLWISHLNAFVAKLADYPNVRLALSCRSDFLQITLPDKLVQQTDDTWAYVTHEGLGESIFEAVGKYFEHYKVETNHFPPLLAEFGNPLFLRLFCESFQNSKVPDGPISFAAVMDKRIEQLGKKLLQDIDCPEDNTKNAISALARTIQENGGKAIAKDAAKKLIDDFSPSGENSKSLYNHLKSNSIIVETTPGLFHQGDRRAVFVRFAFERFADYSIATEILNAIPDVDRLQEAVAPGGRLDWLSQAAGYWKNRGVARALAIAIPERFKRELAEFVTDASVRQEVLNDFLHSVVWRSSESFAEQSRFLFREAAETHGKLAFETTLVAATIPGHPYNAHYLHERLLNLPLAQRELTWTIPLSRLAEPFHSKPSEILNWAMQAPVHLVSDAQARLAGYLLFWFLSSNFRGFRWRATLGAIRLLRNRSRIVAELLAAFRTVNDPYVQERMYAVACGVAMRERDHEALGHLATLVFRQVFDKPKINPHVLLRDYARSILEVAAHKQCLNQEIKKEAFNSPYRSQWPSILTEEEFKQMTENREWGRIVHSTQPNTRLGFMYGDFGRYVMQSEVQQFSNVPLGKVFTPEDKESVFDADAAQRWVLQRVRELGWSTELFKNYDSNIIVGRQNAGAERYKTERIGKKYQWIALHELLGLLSDHFHLATRWGSREAKSFAGVWQLGARDFDPSQPLVDLVEDDDDESSISSADSAGDGYANPFADTALCSDREAWVVKCPDSFEPVIQGAQKSIDPEAEWLTLWGLYEWKEPEFQSFQMSAQGRLKMFMHVRSWIVKRADLKRFLSKVRTLHFWGKGCDLIANSEGWIGEYPWSVQFSSLESYCGQDDDWLDEIGIQHSHSVCAIGSSEKLIAPSPQMYRLLELEWSGDSSDFVDSKGVLQMTQLDVATGYDQRPCLVRKARLLEALERNELAIVWGVVGEKDCYSYKLEKHIVAKCGEFSGIYYLDKSKIKGGITRYDVQPIPRTPERLASLQ
jgi:hypothetical protein